MALFDNIPITERDKELVEKLDDALNLFMDRNEVSFDRVLELIGKSLIIEARDYEDGAVKDCVLGAAENILTASVDYYASTK